MKSLKFLITILLLLSLSIVLYGQENSSFHFKKFQVADGLSENAVYSILQDEEGFMWFGTKDGLNRFDGSVFRIYKHEFDRKESIGNNFIRSLAQMDKDHLYIGTDAGLYIMDKSNESFTRLTLRSSDNSFLNGAINALMVDKAGDVWIATMAQGCYRYNSRTNILQKVEMNIGHKTGNAVWCIMQDRSGTVWVGTRQGLLRYNKQVGKLEPLPSLFSASDNSDNEILSIHEDDMGNLWLGTWSEGLRCYNKQTGSYATYMHRSAREYVTHIRSISPYTEKTLFVGSDDGLFLFDIENKQFKRLDNPSFKYSLSDQNVYAISRDKEGGIWVGTYFGGVNYLNTSLPSMETYYRDVLPGFLSGKAVSQFCEDPSGNLWIATEDGGVNYFNIKTKQISQPVKTSYHNTHALLLDGDDLWIGTFSRGIDVYNTKTGKLVNYRYNSGNINTVNDDCIFSLYRSRSGEIYIGTPVGLNKFDRKEKKFIRINEANGFIYDIKEDDKGNLWLASYGSGAMRLDKKTGKWFYYDKPKNKNANSIGGSKLTGIYIDSQRRLIFSSEGKGIFIYNEGTDDFRNISEADGLPNAVIYGVLDDPMGNLWLSCNKGLICLDPDEPRNFRLFNIENGLQSNQFNYKSSYKSRDGKLYFGGINGFSCFYPQDLNALKNQVVPHVAITQLTLLGSQDVENEKNIQASLNKREKVKLRYDQSSFTVSFVSLSFISQSKNQYAYKLEGADEDWTYAGNNKNVTYVNLPPGKYTFRVKASNNEGLWNEAGSEIAIEIQPPFWWSMPAKVLYTLLAASLIFFLSRYYIKRNKLRQVRQLDTFKADQETKSFKSKIDFFTTIAHEIRTPLSLISAPLEEIVAGGEGSEQTKQNLSIIEKNCDRLTVLINQLLDFRKMDSTEYTICLERIDLKEFMVEMYERFKKSAQKKSIQFDVDLPTENKLIVQSDFDVLTKIVGNLLTNALKFTATRIKLQLKSNTDGSYTITVEDDGAGIADEYKSLIFDPFYQIRSDRENIGTGIGLSLVKHLSSLLKGKVDVADGGNGGTVFLFTFQDLVLKNEQVVPDHQKRHEPALPSISFRTTEELVLVVDDNPDMTDFISNCLSPDYKVDIAGDAHRALKMLNEKNYSLIVSDIMMPGIDGISFVKKIKSDLNYSHVPVILLSAKIENSTKAEGLRSGADVFIEKPFSTAHLKAQISSLLKNRKTLLDAFNRSPLAPYVSLATNKSDEYFLNNLNDQIEKHIADEDFSVESLADVLGISRSNLQRKLKAISGSSPGDYLRNYRLKKACSLLLESDSRINEVAYQVGFNSASYFTKAFYKCYNMSPKEFIKQNVKGVKMSKEDSLML